MLIWSQEHILCIYIYTCVCVCLYTHMHTCLYIQNNLGCIWNFATPEDDFSWKSGCPNINPPAVRVSRSPAERVPTVLLRVFLSTSSLWSQHQYVRISSHTWWSIYEKTCLHGSEKSHKYTQLTTDIVALGLPCLGNSNLTRTYCQRFFWQWGPVLQSRPRTSPSSPFGT